MIRQIVIRNVYDVQHNITLNVCVTRRELDATQYLGTDSEFEPDWFFMDATDYLSNHAEYDYDTSEAYSKHSDVTYNEEKR